MHDENDLQVTSIYVFHRDGDVLALRQENDELRRQLNDKQRRGTSSGPLSGEVSVEF